ncbi:DegV family protein [Tissierella carlieri]|jgi:DegV family protein with EDD domain|uniref:DegV family protein n=1 Tax=Tissierella TaxID=41273 RepID=UPI000B9FFBBD|nr:MULTISPECIES: DegV family protein [Tissierella]MBU5310929.1 DegV family protein [Tissierella carlieri]MDU5081612.1 DegV family protein [Bacillota bacterium]OZV12696.1 fatty acid-binding protein DegV [Tissierella sp. P1]
MPKIKVITDSTGYITREYAEKENIAIVPLNYVFGEETGKEPFPGEFDEFYNKLSTTKLFPSTSQPAAGEFLDAFNKAFEEGYDEIIAIVLSSKLSGTYNSAVLAKNMLENKMITIVDSQMAASNLRFLVEDAVKMAKEEKTSREIENHLNYKKMKMHVYLTTETLEYLSRGGRLSAVQATVGNLLNIKPIIELNNGELKLLEKLRGKNKALSAIIDKVPSNVEKIGVCHVLDVEDARKLKNKLEEMFPNAVITIDELGPVVGAHLGPKGIGICFY